MAIEAQSLADLITESVREQPRQAVTAEAALGDNFCSIWPKAKPALEMVLTLLGFISPQISAVLKGLIKVGDEIYAQTCR